MNSPAKAHATPAADHGGSGHTDLLKEILIRLAQRRLAPIPENFARLYREVALERGRPVAEAPASEYELLLRMVEGLDGLMAENRELGQWLQTLRMTLVDHGTAEEKRSRVEALLARLWRDRSRLLFEVGGTTIKLRESVRRAAREMQSLAQQFEQSGQAFTDVIRELDDCTDIAGAQRLLERARKELQGIRQAMASSTGKVDDLLSSAEEKSLRECALDAVEQAYLAAPGTLDNLLCFEVDEDEQIRLLAAQFKRLAPATLVGKIAPRRGLALFDRAQVPVLLKAAQEMRAQLPALRFGTARLPEQKSVEALREGLRRALGLLTPWTPPAN